MKFFQEYSRRRQIKAVMKAAIELLYTEQFDFGDGLRKLSPKNEGIDFFADLVCIQWAAQLSEPLNKDDIDSVLQEVYSVETQELNAAEFKVFLQQRREIAEQAWMERKEYILKGKKASKKDKYSYDGTIYAMENAKNVHCQMKREMNGKHGRKDMITQNVTWKK